MQNETALVGAAELGDPNWQEVLEASEKRRRARELVYVLIKTIKSYRIYAPKNPTLKRFVNQLHKVLRGYLDQYGPFRLGIEAFQFVFEGEVIYENGNMAESLPFLMHRNGLRELWFDLGLSYRELRAFLQTFRSYEILKDSYEDLVTLLWDRDFSSIHFWATDDFLWAPIDIPQDAAALIEKMEMPMVEQKVEEPETPVPPWRFKPEELDEVRGAIPRQLEEIDYVNLLMILAEVVSHPGADSKGCKPALEFFKTVLDRLVLSQDFNSLIKILSFTRILVRDQRIEAREREFIQAITDYLGEPQSIDRLRASLGRFKNFDHEQLQEYLAHLSKNAIVPLCKAWLTMESAQGRMAISKALVELGKEDVPALAGLLDKSSWQLVLQIINILGKIGKEECIGPIARAKVHENAKVRNEALHALSLFNHPSAKALLPAFLNDREIQIRIHAAKILVERLEAEALSYLAPLVLSPEFERRTLREKKAFLEQLGKIPTVDSVEVLEEILNRKVFFRRKHWREVKSCVASVLASMDSEEAEAVLAKRESRLGKSFFRRLFGG